MFPSLCLASENAFFSYFYSKHGHNLVENYKITASKKNLACSEDYL